MVIWVNTALMRTFAYSHNCKISFPSILVTNDTNVNVVMGFFVLFFCNSWDINMLEYM